MSQPLYRKIYEDLEKAIKSDVFPSGSQLPTEKELSETYQVSRITSKRALTELEHAGFISRIRGKGSFVKDELQKPVKKANKILFILPFINDLYLGNFTEGISPIMQKNDSAILMTTIDYLNQKKADDIIQEFDGLIYYVQNQESYLDLLAELSFKDFPVILLDKKIYDLPFPTVLSENADGGLSSTQFLIQQGHKKIGYLFSHKARPQSVRQRYLGYIQAIKESELDFLTPIDDKQATNDHIVEYVTNHHLTALVCENDLTAITAMTLLKKANLSVPEDFSIIGFDNLQAASLVDPPLTTVAQNFRLIGETAGHYLINWIENDAVPEDTKIPVSLIKRQSTKELNK